jgi:hypothetical protein
MQVKGTVTRVVDQKLFFRPEDPNVFRSLATANLTASGEIVVDVDEDNPHEIGDVADFEVGGDGDDPDEDQEQDEEGEEQEDPKEEGAQGAKKAAGKGRCPSCGAELVAAAPKAKGKPKPKPKAGGEARPEEAKPPEGETRTT